MKFLCLLLLLLGLSGTLRADDLEQVTMQLRWHHQFQFAGYYAAKQQGFYREAGFDVTIVAGAPDRQPVSEVLSGRADFAEGNGEVLLERLKGQPLVALAAVYQHSPSVLLTLKDSAINHPVLLKDKNVMLVKGGADADFHAMFRAVGLEADQIRLIDSSYDLTDLVDGRVDAFNSYLSNEPYFLERQGVAFNVLNPRDYGVDFYSDILFTTEQAARENPNRVERFRQASLKGWQYALNHPEEIIHLIKNEYQSSKSLNHLRYEANVVRSLIQSDLVPLGHMHDQRFLAMAEVFQQQGMISDTLRLDGFMFRLPVIVNERLRLGLVVLAAVALIAVAVALVVLHLNRKLVREVHRRKEAEEQMRMLADTDALTGLANRRAFMNALDVEVSKARRYGDVFSLVMVDLDHFKRVNDRYGHLVGDDVLQHLAGLMQRTRRESDFVARFGGEEFVLLLPRTAEQEARNLAERLRRLISERNFELPSGESIDVTASFGIVEWSEQIDGREFHCVDTVLYQAKAGGRNCVVVWSEE
ncbi:MAG: GGDEF domain-containing protein [Candidatus Pelagadaptatus aseana]|uniref:ABC transporter substrate-binding protein n=1 Tax=Candidatus Pelagadaptatus aseana TaxID=3120508 RepID=UPI0039B337D7